jgi:hypothetical protein
LGTVLLELLLQFLHVFQLKMTNQTNRGLSALQMLFDPQCPARFERSSPSGASAVPAGQIESVELRSKEIADCSEMLIARKHPVQPSAALYAL